jgi:hypothetical protein
MDSRLPKLIGDFQRRVAEAVTMLEAAGVPRPASNMEWATNGVAGRGALANGFAFHKHGFGCAVRGPGWHVDFDFGAEGQIDGFDAWRLYDFAHEHLADYGFKSEEEIKVAIAAAVDAGELKSSGYILYYATNTAGPVTPGGAG